MLVFMVHTAWTTPPEQSKGSVGAIVVGVYHALALLSSDLVWYRFQDGVLYRGNETMGPRQRPDELNANHDPYFSRPSVPYTKLQNGKTAAAVTHLDIARTGDEADTIELHENSLFKAQLRHVQDL